MFKLLSRAKKKLKDLDDFMGGTLGNKQNWTLPDITKLQDTPDGPILTYTPPIEPETLQNILISYNINAKIKDYKISSNVTTYISEVNGVRSDYITRHLDDMARDLSVSSVRIRPLPDGNIGFEIPNTEKLPVGIKDFFVGMPTNLSLPFVVGEDSMGDYIYRDLTKMPHLLVAGVTGSGKSVYLNTTICGYLCYFTPDQVQFMMIDPKEVEFMDYDEIPHLMEPIATETTEAINILDQSIEIMEERFDMFKNVRARNMEEYRSRTGDSIPYIVIVVDEYADLMLMGKPKDRKEVEQKISRIAQKARAVGIHLILATQKPISTVVTSTLKANLPARIAFNVASGIDSRVILDETGAEKLTGKGDMIYKDPSGISMRIQAPWISPEDIEYITRSRS